jgi:hypothetical protein
LFMHFLGYDHRRGGLIWTRFLLVNELQPVIPQTQPVHLYLTAGSPQSS